MLGPWYHEFIEAITGWSDYAVFLRLLLATFAGFVVGMNRTYKNKGAGIKTHTLVSIGSALSVIVAEYVLHQYPNLNTDVTRIGAQVISGVGFLGVGTIIVTGKNEVRGLTTAAGIWSCACIGLAAGMGYVTGTLIALFFVLLTYTGLTRLDSFFHHMSRTFDLYVEFEDSSGVKAFLKKLHTWDCSYTNFLLTRGDSGQKLMAVTVSIELNGPGRKQAFIEAVQNLPFVSFCDEI